VGLRNDEWGKKEEILEEITQKEWDIPCSGRSYIGRSTVLEWQKASEFPTFRVNRIPTRDTKHSISYAER